MTDATVIRTLETGEPGVEVVALTLTGGESYTSRKFEKVFGAIGSLNHDTDVTVKPTDQVHSWIDFDPVGYAALSKKRMRVRIDDYKAPLGDGWIIQIEFKYAGIGPDPYGTDPAVCGSR